MLLCSDPCLHVGVEEVQRLLNMRDHFGYIRYRDFEFLLFMLIKHTSPSFIEIIAMNVFPEIWEIGMLYNHRFWNHYGVDNATKYTVVARLRMIYRKKNGTMTKLK